MVCNCNIYSLDRGRTIYEVESELICSYIVLWGTVEIYSQEGELQGFYEAGSTLCEEYLLVGAPTKIGEKARAGKRGAGILELSQNSLRTIRHPAQERPNHDGVSLQKEFLQQKVDPQ
jgi:hypothetical protein